MSTLPIPSQAIPPAYATLFTPPDALEAHETWGANCGPCALAAVLGVPVSRVRRMFPDFARKPWVNPSTMWTALALAGRTAVKRGTAWPTYGLAFLQWHGPWLNPGVPPTVAYRYTHWIGIAITQEYGWMAYDVNAQSDEAPVGAWVPSAWWNAEIAPAISCAITGATGEWSTRWTCEVLAQEQTR